jgi:hypothetical protein
MATKKTKLVEPGLYSGRTSHGGEDGLGVCHEVQPPQDEGSRTLKKNQGDVPDARRTTGAGNDRHGLNPAFDSDEPRKHAKSTGGGGNCEKSPFSAAHKNFK